MKYSTNFTEAPRDFAPRQPYRRDLLEPIGNAVGTIYLAIALAGMVVMILSL